MPDLSIIMQCLRRTRLILWLTLPFQFANGTDFLEQVHDTFSINDPNNRFHLQLSGLLDLETYLIDQPAPGLIFTDDDVLFNPRLTLFLDVQVGSHIYVFAQARADRGFDPTDQGAQVRLDEYFLRYSFGKEARINFQIGQFATVVGNWVQRHDSWLNPFINAPLPYENLTGMWDIAAPDNVDELLRWGHVPPYDNRDYSDKYLRLPIVWGPSYASGISVSATFGKFDWAVEMKNSALASRPESWSVTSVGFDNPTFSTRLGVRPDERWNIGFSASGGPYLLSEAVSSLRPGSSIGDYREFVLAQDVSFAWHRLQLWAEFYEARFEGPYLGNADTFSYYLEAKYKITPQLFGALRWNQQFYGTIENGKSEVRWGNNIQRVDAALGYRFTSYLQGKLQYSLTHRDASFQEGEHLLAGQLTLKF